MRPRTARHGGYSDSSGVVSRVLLKTHPILLAGDCNAKVAGRSQAGGLNAHGVGPYQFPTETANRVKRTGHSRGVGDRKVSSRRARGTGRCRAPFRRFR